MEILLLLPPWDPLLLRLRLRRTTIKSLPQPTIEYIHNPSFVGALVATFLHTAVRYDTPHDIERLMFDTNLALAV